MVRMIELVPCDATWPDLFRVEATLVGEVFGPELVAIHHVGSTAIPGILAKPIVDILLEVRSIEAVDSFNNSMTELGYLPTGENGIPGRRYFRKATDLHHTHHVHAFQAGHPEVERHLIFRDYLIAHPDEAQAYSRLKEELRDRFPEDVTSYACGKDAFIAEIVRRSKEA
jgi:GrpB-like predicted nucleotidyltransferase (UPF0157 family)